MNTIKYSVLAIATISVVLLGTTSIASATTFGSWDDPSHTYWCTTSLPDIQDTANVEPCNDLSVAAGTWNQVSGSNWHFIETPNYISTTVPIFGCDTASLGFFVPTPSSADPITSGYVCFSTNYAFGDVNAGDTNTYDYLTLAIHEYGHVPGLAHSAWNDSVMKSGQSLNQVKTTLHFTDIWDIQGLYP